MREVRQAVALFSLRTGRDRVVEKMMSMVGHLPLSDLQRGSVSAGDWPRLVRSAAEVSRAPMFINDSVSTTVEDMRTSLTNVSRDLHTASPDGSKVELGLVIVDDLHLMLPREGAPNESEEQAAYVLRSLKHLAREVNAPILALSHLPRAAHRHDRRPLISDFDPAEPADQFADVLTLLYRDEFYNPDSDDKGIAEVIIAKNRNGPTGKVIMAFLDRVGGRFASLR